MFIITITVSDSISAEQYESLFSGHAKWFRHYFQTGIFVVVGPYADRERSGVIIANVESLEALTTILKEDPFYPDLATYEVRPFIAKMIAENLHQLQQG